ncbi:MAG TPA: hypothetical protein VE951_00760 [Candidatus Angelobacter sp.]|jgi:hypothetical protein|nr:hypothetical protein [Candidatus Angelobacter sp.]
MPSATREDLAARAFAAAAHDFSPLLTSPGVLLSRPARHGVAVVVLPTVAIPAAALDALLAWRLGQYLLTGFYDLDAVADRGLRGEPREQVHDRDLHALAIDEAGQLLCYLTLKQPAAITPGSSWTYRDPDRPLFPCEEVHGRRWQARIGRVDDVPAASCWELARFVKDQRRSAEPLAMRAPLEVALGVARLARRPKYQTFHLVTGDLDPEVALRNVRFFFVPVATFPSHRVALPPGHPLAPRYREHDTAPFVGTVADVDYATYVRWADINLALSCEDPEASVRLLALRQFVSVKESSLKLPLPLTGDSAYPIESLVSPSSKEASTALWNAAQRKRIPWEALVLGPGEELPRDRVSWIIEGYAQALTYSPAGLSHLAGLGPEVAFVPQEEIDGSIASVEAATPLRLIATKREHFDDFWRQRQLLFETATSSLYGAPALAAITS